MVEKDRKIVVVNQAVNYLTIGLCNAFKDKFSKVVLITGSIHVQGEELNEHVKVESIVKWVERPAWRKLYSYLGGTLSIYFLLLFKYRKYEVIFVSIPPMAYLLSSFLPNRTSVLIWDVYPDVFKIIGMTEKHPVYRLWAYLNRRVFRKSYRLFTISERMADLLSVYVDKSKILITPIWSIFQHNIRYSRADNKFLTQHNIQDKFIVQYSGNIGLTHNVEVVVEIAKLMRGNDEILFQIIGRGPRMPYLKKMVENENLKNCMFLPFQSDEDFPYSLSAASVGVVILDKVTSKGSVPSKTYNLMSLGIPMLFIASEDSELAYYAKKFGLGECFDHSDLSGAIEFLFRISKSQSLYKMYSDNALLASAYFKRANADKIAELYF